MVRELRSGTIRVDIDKLNFGFNPHMDRIQGDPFQEFNYHTPLATEKDVRATWRFWLRVVERKFGRLRRRPTTQRAHDSNYASTGEPWPGASLGESWPYALDRAPYSP